MICDYIIDEKTLKNSLQRPGSLQISKRLYYFDKLISEAFPWFIQLASTSRSNLGMYAFVEAQRWFRLVIPGSIPDSDFLLSVIPLLGTQYMGSEGLWFSQ